VLAAVRPSAPSEDVPSGYRPPPDDPHLIPICDSLAPAFLRLQQFGDPQVDVSERREPSCQKLLFSATLTRDPGKLASLGLRDPKYFVVQNRVEGTDSGALDLVCNRFTMPATLTVRIYISIRTSGVDLWWLRSI
jgi:ATP-dependent RNA helicase DDX51/DBP6